MVNLFFIYCLNCLFDFLMEVLLCEIFILDILFREIYLELDIFLLYICINREKSYCVFDRVLFNSNKFIREVE